MKIMCTGTFDVLHYGHINILKKAKEKGDYLRVGLNVTKNGLPTYYSYEERKKMLEAIRYVDEVVPIPEQKAKLKYLKDIDIFVCSSEYKGYDDIPDIEKHCKVEFVDRTPGISSTKVKSDNTKYNTYVIDLDDTICYTIDRRFNESIPNMAVIKKINELYDKGWHITIFTARRSKKL